MSGGLLDSSAESIAAAVRGGDISTREVIAATLARIAERNPKLGAFTDVTAARAMARAEAIDAARARGETLGPLAGAPFAVKNLFDIEGLPTRAGSKINRERAPASADATLTRRLEAAGAVLVGALNMGEYAYDFTGENAHDGPSRNPHDLGAMTGGSSGGSGGAVAGGLTPIALGSDTNGSIRVPASFCGVFGLKPTYGRLSRAGSFPFVASLDHLGALARSVGDLAASFDAIQGADAADPAQADRPVTPTRAALDDGIADLRIATLGGYFARGGEPQAFAAVARVAQALRADRSVELPGAEIARAAAYLITMTEGAALHLDRLRERAGDFDADVRDRLIAGAMLPGVWYARAQKFRRAFLEEARALFAKVDVLIAPATPCPAPRLGQKTFVLDGREQWLRPNIGVFTQPLSFIGLPVVAAPIWALGCRSACRSSPRPGARISRCASRARSSARASRPRRRPREASPPPRLALAHAKCCSWPRRCSGFFDLVSASLIVDDPQTKAEVEAAFAAYESALTTNDVGALDRFFHAAPTSVRYGAGETLYGYDAIRAFRAARSPAGLERRLEKTQITAYGRDFAVASTLFRRASAPGKIGRQMQTWARFPEGWRIVAAHVSLIDG